MKKYINLTIAVFTLAFLFSSCETDIDRTTSSLKKNPDNLIVNTNVPLICSADNAADTAFVVKWDAADFGENISSTYTLQIDLEGNNFATPYAIVVGNNRLEKAIVFSELNNIMHKFDRPTDVPTNLEVRVSSRPMVLGSSAPTLPTAISDSKITINVTSFARVALHMVGTMFGCHPAFAEPAYQDSYAWDPTNYRYVMFRNSPLALDTYTAQFRKSENDNLYMGSFKLMENHNFGTWNMLAKKSDGVLGGGDNIEDFPTEGYYTLTVDVVKMIYTVKPFDASGIVARTSVKLTGAGVSAPVAMTQHLFNPHIWVADEVTLTANEVKFDLDGETWSAATFPWGTATSGGETLRVGSAGKYFVKYNDLTGHYIFYKKP